MTPDERVQLRALADRVRGIRAHDRLRPHVFTEDKSEVAHALDELATPDAKPVRQMNRDLKLSFGTDLRRTVVAGRGASVTVERRSRPALKRP